jgi:hypothetical protein
LVLTISPLETLAAFFLAFAGGILFGLGLCRYAKQIRKDALRAVCPA